MKLKNHLYRLPVEAALWKSHFGMGCISSEKLNKVEATLLKSHFGMGCISSEKLNKSLAQLSNGITGSRSSVRNFARLQL